MAGPWTTPFARLEALVEGTYPVVPVPGTTVTAGRYKATRLHGSLSDPDFPLAHFDRGYALVIETSGYASGEERHNRRGGLIRERATVNLQVGYLLTKRGPAKGPGVGTSLSDMALQGRNDHSEILSALIEPSHWSGTDIYSVARDATDTVNLLVVPHERLIVQARYVVEISYTPGTVWP